MEITDYERKRMGRPERLHIQDKGKKAAESAGSFDIDAIRSVAVKLGDPLRF